MACSTATLTGIALDCGNVGGIQKIYVANVADVSTILVDVSGEVSGITMEASSKFKTYSFRKGNASYSVEGTRDDKNGTYFATTKITAQFNKMDKDKRSELIQLVKSNAYVIVLDYNNIYWFVGKDSYVTLTTGSGQSGSAMGDGNFYNIELMSETSELPMTIANGIVSAIIE